MASGPRCGLHEINLPPKAPGSSIMPGKVNPVIPEVVNQVCFKVIGNDTTVSFAAEAGQLQLNVMEPVITESLFESLIWLKRAIETLTEECILGITVNKEHCMEMVKNSIGIVTALNPYIGYKTSTKVAKEALETNRSVYDIVLEKGLMTQEKLDEALDPQNMLVSHKFIK
jgi:aspartate ammonia-lyase